MLDQKARRSAVMDAGNGWVLQAAEGALVVVARGSGAHTAAEAHAQGVHAAQRGLDLLSFRLTEDLLIRRADDESLVWWSEPDGQRVIRATSTAPLHLDVGIATLRVFDAAGNEKPPPPEPPPVWHPSFRYFRLAQVSDEVFDAYRNLFLALESILSQATPKLSSEGERQWIARALHAAEADGADISGHAPAGAQNPVAAIVSDLYSATRTATFHAKVHSQTLLPLDPVDRRAIIDRLSRLAGLYLELVAQTLGVRRASSAMTAAGFNLMIGTRVTELVVHITEDTVRFDEAATSVNPGGGRVIPIPTKPDPDHDEPFLRAVIGEVAVTELASLTHVSRIATVAADGTPITGGQLEAPLTLGGFDRFEAVMGVRGLNRRLPRTFYST